MAGGILDFISRGGSGINYYPWHGGTNLGRNSMYLFDVDATRDTVARSFVVSEWKPVTQPDSRPLAWLVWDEPLPAERHDKGIASVEPVEQLSLTKDSTDYCWYSATLQVAEAGAQEIVIPYGADFFYLYVDGVLAATSKTPLSEDRGPITPDDPGHPRIVANTSENGHPHGFQHSFILPQVTPGPHRIDLLVTALGMIKGDWQIASPMNFERKGIWEGVKCNGTPLQNWMMKDGLVGEQHKLPARPASVSWRVASDTRTLRWYKTRLEVPRSLLGGSAVFRMDAAGLGKGMIWVNGRAVGRHWLIQARSPADTLSQRHYHVPSDWLQLLNEIVILEEQLASPATVQLQSRT